MSDKVVVAPDRCPAEAHWSIHEIVGMRTRKMKFDETSLPPFQPDQHKLEK